MRIVSCRDRCASGSLELVADLSGRGYRGPWSLETFNPTYWADDPKEIATTGLRLLRDLLGAPAARSTT